MLDVIAFMNKHLDLQLQFGIQYGMPTWFVPLSVFPVARVAEKHLSLYLRAGYADGVHEAASFQAAWRATGKKLDVGNRACVLAALPTLRPTFWPPRVSACPLRATSTPTRLLA
jgi:hypothetical protein